MATRVKEYIDSDTGLALIEYDDGMIRRADNGQIFSPAPGRIITPENSIALHRARKERRIQTARAVANENPAAAKHKAAHGDMAYVAVIQEKAMEKALRPGDPKQIEAAKFVLSLAGDSDEEDTSGTINGIGMVKDIVGKIAEIARLYAENTGADVP